MYYCGGLGVLHLEGYRIWHQLYQVAFYFFLVFEYFEHVTTDITITIQFEPGFNNTAMNPSTRVAPEVFCQKLSLVAAYNFSQKMKQVSRTKDAVDFHTHSKVKM